jgi:hypothetical protein
MAKKEASKKVVDDIKPAAPVAAPAPAPAPSKDVLQAGEEIIERLGMRFIRNVDEGTIRRI